MGTRDGRLVVVARGPDAPLAGGRSVLETSPARPSRLFALWPILWPIP
jgi:hypothetical protein